MQKLCTLALALGLSLAAVPSAFADEAPPPKAKKEKAGDKKAKAGEACKTNADCDQNDAPQQCRSNKCESRGPVHPVT
jgi:hypothetical protein